MAVNEQNTHGIAAYKRGCRCEVCRAAQAAARRRQRAAAPDKARASHAAKGNVVSLPTTQQPAAPAEMGPNETAVRAELELMPRAAERPGIAAMCITLAQSMDDVTLKAIRSGNSKQLQSLLESLRGPKRKSGGRLQVVSQMAGRGKVAQ